MLETLKKDRWKVWMGNMGVIPFVLAIVGTFSGFKKGQNAADQNWSNRFEAETARWEMLSIQAEKNAQRQVSLAIEEGQLSHREELRKHQHISKH